MMLVRGSALLTDPAAPGGAIVEDGGVYIQGDRIVEVGHYAELAARYPQAELLGAEDDVVMPGLVNAHDHGRAPSTAQ